MQTKDSENDSNIKLHCQSEKIEEQKKKFESTIERDVTEYLKKEDDQMQKQKLILQLQQVQDPNVIVINGK